MSIKIFNWEKDLISENIDKLVNLNDIKQLSTCGQNAYFGRSVSAGEKFRHRLEIAAIIIGTLLILPIPLLGMTDCYKRLARRMTESNKNFSIEGKIDNFVEQVFKNEKKILNGAVKIYRKTIQVELLDRLQKCYKEVDQANGTINIELINNSTDATMGNLLYEFQYDKKQENPFKVSLKNANLKSTNVFKGFTDIDLKCLRLYKSIFLQDKDGKTLNNYGNSQAVIDFLPKS